MQKAARLELYATGFLDALHAVSTFFVLTPPVAGRQSQGVRHSALAVVEHLPSVDTLHPGHARDLVQRGHRGDPLVQVAEVLLVRRTFGVGLLAALVADPADEVVSLDRHVLTVRREVQNVRLGLVGDAAGYRVVAGLHALTFRRADGFVATTRQIKELAFGHGTRNTVAQLISGDEVPGAEVPIHRGVDCLPRNGGQRRSATVRATDIMRPVDTISLGDLGVAAITSHQHGMRVLRQRAVLGSVLGVLRCFLRCLLQHVVTEDGQALLRPHLHLVHHFQRRLCGHDVVAGPGLEEVLDDVVDLRHSCRDAVLVLLLDLRECFRLFARCFLLGQAEVVLRRTIDAEQFLRIQDLLAEEVLASAGVGLALHHQTRARELSRDRLALLRRARQSSVVLCHAHGLISRKRIACVASLLVRRADALVALPHERVHPRRHVPLNLPLSLTSLEVAAWGVRVDFAIIGDVVLRGELALRAGVVHRFAGRSLITLVKLVQHPTEHVLSEMLRDLLDALFRHQATGDLAHGVDQHTGAFATVLEHLGLVGLGQHAHQAHAQRRGVLRPSDHLLELRHHGADLAVRCVGHLLHDLRGVLAV